jgi:hypothetical protein
VHIPARLLLSGCYSFWIQAKRLSQLFVGIARILFLFSLYWSDYSE